METIKNLLNPGHKDDENTMYGSVYDKEHTTGQSSTIADGRQTATNTQSYQSDSANEGSGVLRQIVNPNHDKYNETQYGSAGSTTARTELPPTVGADQTLHTRPEQEKKEGGILRQILNPGGGRYDEVAYGGNTATTSPLSQDNYSSSDSRYANTQSGGVSRQIMNPSGDRYDPVMHGTTASSNPSAVEEGFGTSPFVTKSSGIDSHHGDRTIGQSTGAGAYGEGLAHREKPTTSTSGATSGLNVVNTAAGPRIPGSSITAPGLAAAAVNDGTTDDSSVVGDARNTIGSSGVSTGHHHGHHHDTPVRTVNTAMGPRIPGSSITAPGLAAAATADGAEFDDSSRSTTHHHTGLGSTRSTGVSDSSLQRPGDLPPVPATGGEFMGGAGPGAYSGTQGTTGERSFPLSGSTTTSSTHGLNDGRAGLAGAAGAATGLAAFVTHEHGGHKHNYEGPSLGSNSGTEGHAPGGPHTTWIANLLDPNIGSSTSTGTTSGLGTSTGTTSGLGSSTGATSGLGSTTGTTSGLGSSTGTTSGLGSTTGTSSALGSSTTGPTSGLSSSGLGSSGSAVGDHGLSRDSALTGSSGGPAKNTVGPHSADWKNVLDPRVKPDFSSGSNTGSGVPATGAAYSETSGRNTSAAPVQGERGLNSGTANPYSSTGLDPRVDALGAGAGVGAAGLGAHEVSKHHGSGIGGVSRGAQDPSIHHGAPNPTGGATIGTASGQTATIPSSSHATSTTTGQAMSSGVEQERKHARELDAARSHQAEKAHHGQGEHHEGEKKESFIHKLLHRHKDDGHN